MPGTTDIHARPRSAVLGRTVAAALPRWFASVRGDPMITYVDQLTGERTELSHATVANWAAKGANLLQADAVDHVRLRADGHWASVPAAIAAWRLGLPVVAEGSVPTAGRGLTVAYEDVAAADDLAVGPGLGGRLSRSAPPCRSFVDEVLGEPDDVLADPPPPEAIAMIGMTGVNGVIDGNGTPDRDAGDATGAMDLSAAVAALLPAPDRWLVLDPVGTAPGLVAVAAAVQSGVSLVITRGKADATLDRLRVTERVGATAASPRHDARAPFGDMARVELPAW